MDDTYKNIQEYNPNKKRKISIFCDNMIANMLSNKKLNPIVTELFMKKAKHYSCFYNTVLFCRSKKILD